jgi:type I restriction enzyme R subunit
MDDLEKLSEIHWKDAAGIETAITQKIPKFLASDQAYQNARKHSDCENIRIESELAIQRAISAILSDYIELFQQFTQNPGFKERLTSFVLTLVDDQQRAN